MTETIRIKKSKSRDGHDGQDGKDGQDGDGHVAALAGGAGGFAVTGVGTTHHVKLGDQFLIVRPNTYQKSPAPTFGARITTGDPDYNNLSIWQHWVQKCWVGGMGADEWVDDAMYKDAVGLDTTVHEKATLGRHLRRAATPTGWTVGTNGTAGLVKSGRFIVWKNVLYCLTIRDSPATSGDDSLLYSYDPATQVWTQRGMPGNSFWARCITTYDGKLLIGGTQTSTGAHVSALYWTTDTTPTAGSWTKVLHPTGVSTLQDVTAMRVYNSKLYVCFLNHVWRLLTTFDKTSPKQTDVWDGGTEFYKINANSGSNYIAAMETHLGFLYMLSANGHLHRTDGNNTFDIWSWDGQTRGVSLRSYDGKLFVGTYEWTDTDDIGFGVLYQFTGAAVTELKRWGVQGKATVPGQMITYARKLLYGAAGLFGVRGGFGVAVYDSVEDGHSIFAMQDNVTSYPDHSVGLTGMDWVVDDLIVFGGKLFVFVREHGAFYTEDSFQDVEKGRAQYSTSLQGGTLTSSMYDGGTPGLEKLWRRITVWCDLPGAATTLLVSYSIDGGVTWIATPLVTGPSLPGGQYNFYLNNVRSTRFQYRIRLKTTDETISPVLRAISVAYLPQPEPGWSWSFVVPVSDKWELRDGSMEQKDTNTLIAYLEGLYRSQQLVEYTDIDGKEWAGPGKPGVLVYDLNVVHYDIENPREADVRVTLLETVENYGS